jgi:hypothetical protein
MKRVGRFSTRLVALMPRFRSGKARNCPHALSMVGVGEKKTLWTVVDRRAVKFFVYRVLSALKAYLENMWTDGDFRPKCTQVSTQVPRPKKLPVATYARGAIKLPGRYKGNRQRQEPQIVCGLRLRMAKQAMCSEESLAALQGAHLRSATWGRIDLQSARQNGRRSRCRNPLVLRGQVRVISARQKQMF